MSKCMGCMKEKGDSKICPHCGYEATDKDAQNGAYLPEGTILQNRYLLGKVLGQGGFGITYIGYDNTLNIRVAIKEYYPSDIAQRTLGSKTISPFTQFQSDYEHGKKRFIEEARTLAKFSDFPGIVSVSDCFEDGGSAYMVMQFLEGVTLKEYLNRKGNKIDPNEAISILTPVMDALREVHRAGIIHRDISPDNIFITSDGQVKLIDFGAARESMGGGKSLSIQLKQGYAPEEQYRAHGNQGSWTDVYALAATLYRMVTGETPPESIERLSYDTLIIPEDLPENIRIALQMGLAVRAPERYATVEQFQNALNGKATVSSIVVDTNKDNESIKKPSEDSNNKDKPHISNKLIALLSTVAALSVIIAISLAIYVSSLSAPANQNANEAVNGDGSEATPAPTQAAADIASAPTVAPEAPPAAPPANAVPAANTENNTVKYQLYVVNCRESISLRTSPSTSANVITMIPLGSQVGFIENSSNGFYKIMYQGSVGYALSSYLADSMTEHDNTVKSYMYVAYCESYITLRSEPSSSASAITTIPLGEQVGFIEQTTSDFAKVNYNNLVGYVMSSYLSSSAASQSESSESELEGEPADNEESQSSPVGGSLTVVNCQEWISLRSSPSTSASRITEIPLGATVQFIDYASNGFYQVSYNGYTGYALAQYLA